MDLHSAGNLLHLGMPAQRIEGEVASPIGLQGEAFVLHSEKEGSSNGHEACEFKMASAKGSSDKPQDVHVEKSGELVLHVELPGTSEECAGDSVINRPRQTQKAHAEPHMTYIV